MREVSPIVKDDKTFLILYRLLYYKHVLTQLPTGDRRPTLKQYVEAWYAYREFFVLALTDAPDLNLPATWLYEMISEFLYHYQQFHEARGGASATAGGDDEVLDDDFEEGAGSGAARLVAPAAKGPEQTGTVLEPGDLDRAWQLSDVFGYLNALVAKADIINALAAGTHPQGFRALTGYFSLVGLVRLHCKLGDYAAALEAARPLNIPAGDGPFTRLSKCHASLIYYAGFALMMSRRYEDALRLFNRTLNALHRQAQVLHDGGGDRGNAFLKKQADKMLALLAVCVIVCPGVPVEEPSRKAVRDKYGDLMEKVTASTAAASASASAPTASAAATSGGAGAAEPSTAAAPAPDAAAPAAPEEDVLDKIFAKASPGYLTYSPPSLIGTKDDAGASLYVDPKDVQAVHLRLFKAEVVARTTGIATLRSYLRLYTNMDVAKLASYIGTTPEETRYDAHPFFVRVALASLASFCCHLMSPHLRAPRCGLACPVIVWDAPMQVSLDGAQDQVVANWHDPGSCAGRVGGSRCWCQRRRRCL